LHLNAHFLRAWCHMACALLLPHAALGLNRCVSFPGCLAQVRLAAAEARDRAQATAVQSMESDSSDL
jgi:hypothetical protein